MSFKSLFFALSITGLFVSSALFTSCQSEEAKAKKNLVEQSNLFIQSVVNNDVPTMMGYLLPEFIESQGGHAALTQTFLDQAKRFEVAGIKLSKGKAIDPSAFYTCNETIQCVLTQEAYMESASKKEPMKMQSNMIAISKDDGATWKFLQIGLRDLDAERKKFPILCEGMELRKFK